jgi:hypothetical protein
LSRADRRPPLTGTATLTALLLPVPEAEALVGAWRRRYDPSEAWGVPAHITLVYPFVPPSGLGTAVIGRLRPLFAAHPPVNVRLAEIRRFGDGVLYLAPEPPDPIRALTNAIVDAFPAYPPYEGAFDEVIPHLTVADGAPLDAMAEAEADLARRLPVRCTLPVAWLMAGRDGSGPWRVIERFPLGG